jgi:O-antigen ligase
MFYIFYRPILQGYAMEHEKLVAALPLTGVFAIVLITYSITICTIRKGYTLFAPNATFLYLLLFFSVFSFLNTLSTVNSAAAVLKILTAVALYNLVYSSIKSISDAKKILYSLVLASVVPMLVGYFQFFTGAGRKGIEGLTNRVIGTLGIANAFGIFLVVCLCATLALLLQKNKGFQKRLLICILSSIVVCTIIALNRGTWIALATALFVAYIGYRKKVKVRWIIVPCILIAIIFSGMMIQRFMQLKEKSETGQSTNTFARRVETWKNVISLVPKHPVIGFGIGTAQEVTIKFYRHDAVPHNDYARLLLEIGVPGLLCYIIFLLRELYRSLKLTFDQKSWFVNFPVLICIIYWIIISFAQNIIYHVVNFSIFLALIAVSYRWNELTFNSERA